MRRFLLPLTAAFTLFVALQATPAAAQATRTWVSGVGDDANPCSRTAPCKTFAGAISKTAAAGEINCLDPGGFGAVTITKSLAILCDGFLGGVLASFTNGIIVNTAATDIVTLSGLDIEGNASGINGVTFIGAGTLHVRRSDIRGFRGGGSGINFAPSGGGELYVTDTTIADNGNGSANGGILIAPGVSGYANAHISRVRLENNSVGIIADGSLSSLGVNVNVQDSVISGNENNGVLTISTAGHAPTTVSIIGSMITGNFGAGLSANGTSATGAGSAIIRIGSSSLSANAAGLTQTGAGQVRSYGNNQVNASGGVEIFSFAEALK